MSIASTLNIGKQALLAHQRAIQVASRNVANANTPGYSRQRAIFEPQASLLVADGFSLGGGVSVEQVQRIVDLNLENQILGEKQNSARQGGLQTGLARIEDAFQELGDSGIGKSLTAFFAALGDLSNDPGEASVRESVLTSLQSVVDQIHSSDRRLAQVAQDANNEIPIEVNQINDLAQSIAKINEEIIRREVGSREAFSELRDQRNVLLQQLGEKIDFTSFERPDGSITVFVGGGFVLVDGISFGGLQASTTQPTPLADPTFLNVYHVINGSVSGPITNLIRGGSLDAALSLRDDRVQFYRQQLDSFAFTLADRLNTVHLAGRGLEDDNARNLLIDPLGAGANPPGATLSAVQGAAGSIDINPDILANSRHLAAGQPAVGPAASGDNTNALALTALRESTAPFFAVGDPVGGPATGPTQSLPGFFSSVAAVLGSEIQSNQRAVEQSDLVLAELEDRRGQISGVSLDEEVADLVRFQRGYEASARIIKVADDLFKSLLAI